jgi:long-subunit acyl-CoA synthetase (AMP-forming)
MIRYFKQEELTKETITEDGWYKTGDIGQWESDGILSIIDRIKNLVSLSMCAVVNLMIGQITEWRIHCPRQVGIDI